jgi:hypothetical protein
MWGMRKLSYEYKLPGRSIPEVYERFNQSLIRHQGSGRTKFMARKLSAEALTNAIALHFLDLDFDEQERILALYVPRFEALLSAEPDADPPQTVNAHDEDAPPPPSPRRKKRG